MRTRLALAFSLLLTGCATTQSYDQYLERWVGTDINGLIRSWGPPTSIGDAPGGGKVYTWDEAEDSFVYVHRKPYSNSPARTYWCKTTFITYKAGAVKTWRWDGNACRAR
jgi:hypothetical protein